MTQKNGVILISITGLWLMVGLLVSVHSYLSWNHEGYTVSWLQVAALEGTRWGTWIFVSLFVIEEIYLGVVFYEEKNVEELTKGFHREFNMYVLHENELDKRTLKGWMERLAENTTGNTQEKKARYSHHIDMIDITGTTAVVKLKIYHDSKLRYTDFLTSYKFAEGWKVITKLFTYHGG